MSVDGRLSALERELEDRGGQEGVIIKVLRIPPDVPEDAEGAWIASHPEAISKTVEIDSQGGLRITRYDD
jgi:hypothetical protein